MADLALTLFGIFKATLNGEPLQQFRTVKVQALLIYLATEAGVAHRREALMELLWPGLPLKSAQLNLRQTLFRLRKMIPELTTAGGDRKAPFLLSDRLTVQVNPDVVFELDVGRFDELIGQSRRHDHLSLVSCHECQERLSLAVRLYSGSFLADFYLTDSNDFEDWAAGKREAYRRQALDALDTLTAVELQRGAFVEAQAFARQQIEIDYLDERAYRRLFEALARNGQRNEALAEYDNLGELLAVELGMEPATRTTEIVELILGGDLTFEADALRGIRGYELGEKIGAGTMGTIHLAVQPSIGRKVAVKVIQRQYADKPEFIRSFETEAQTIARLEHPYIVPLYDYWRDPDGAYLVMRYLRGGNLLSTLEGGPWELEAAARMLDQIAAALNTAHRQGVVHRDIKPANILLDEDGNSYLTDFGIAKDLTGEVQLAAEGVVIGTPEYISPEQIKNEPISPQTDLYNLGAVLYETLTGQKPFPDSSLANLIFLHLNEPVPLVGASRPDLPAEIDQVIQRATAKRPGDRYANALEMAEAFRAALGGLETMVGEKAPFAVPTVTDLYNPYKGLRAFQEADAEDFFGREALVDQFIAGLNDSRFMAIVGPSGSGKSSAVKAGLLPALRQGAIPGSDKWFVAEMSPGTHPLEELELALWPIAVDPPPSLIDPMARDTRGMLRTLRRIMPDERESAGGNTQLLLVIDQFEELFTLVEDPARRAFFLDSLMIALNSPRSPLRVVITLRADFYDRPLQSQLLGQLLKENTEIVLPLSPSELTWAVREPARRVGVSLEQGLSEAIVADVADQPGALPLLQYAMTELFERRDGRRMTRQVYDEIGGVAGALGKRAEEIYAGQEAARQETARQLFLRLVTLGEGVEDTRRRVLRAELNALGQLSRQGVEGAEEVPGSYSPISEVIDAYGDARLLTFDHDPVTRGPTAEVAHEALLREWPRLRGWLDDSRNDVRLQRMLAAAVAEWDAAGRDEGYLMRGARLDQFAGWAGDSSVALTADESAFLESSIASREDREAKEAERRQRELETARKLAETERERAEDQAQAAGRLRQRAIFLTGALVVAAILAVVAFAFARQSNQNAAVAGESANLAATREGQALAAQAEAVQQREVAEAQRTTAEELRQVALVQASIGLASQSGLELSGNNPERAVLLALEAIENYPYTWQAESALGQAVFANQLDLILPHEGSVNAVRWSPDQTRILTASSDGMARVWDAASGELLFTLDHEDGGEVYTMNWSPAGDQVTTVASDQNKVYIWDTSTGQLDLTLDGHEATVWQGAWSPSGDRILTNSDDQTAKIWDAVTGEEITTFSGHNDSVYACTVWGDCSDGILAWSPDGDRVVTSDKAGEIFVWDPVTGETLLQLSGHEDWVNMATWSPDGRWISSASDDGTARIWDANAGEQIAIYGAADTRSPIGTVWSPDSDRVLVHSNRDASIIIIDAATGEELVVFDDHGDGIWAAIWSDDGNRILSGSLDGTARIWDSWTGKVEKVFRGHSADIFSVAWSPSEERIVTGSADGTAKVWSVAGTMVDLEMPAGGANSDWSPANDLIARSNTGEQEHQVQIIDVNTGELKLTFPAHTFDERFIRQVEFSPSGQALLTISGIGPARVWKVEDGKLLTEVLNDANFNRTAWSPEGTKFATATRDIGVVQIWDTQTGVELLAFDEHYRTVRGLAWSPDGGRIASASDAGDLLIWDPATGEILFDLFPDGLGLRVGNPAWSADGARLAAYRDDGFLSVWDSDTGELLQSLSGPGGFARWLSWFPSGDRLLAADEDNDLKVWDVESGTEVLSLTLFGSDAGLSSDGQQFLANVDSAGPLIIFDIWESLDELVSLAKECCVIRELTPEERVEFGLD